jgi:protein KRI1
MKLIEGDYDPEKFEKKMQETFGDEFYERDDPAWKTDHDVRDALMKDEDGNLIAGQGDDGDLYDEAEDPDDDGAEYGAEEETGDDGWANDEDYQGDDAEEYEEEEGTELERKLKAKMEDELYKLDYEDIVAGMPTRFKYRQVEANDYGLSAEEILFAKDATLKQFVSLKKMAPYREEGEYNANGRKRRRFRETLKLEIEEELEASGKQEPAEIVVNENEPEEEEATSKKRKRRRSKKNKSDEKEEKSTEIAVAEEKVCTDVEKAKEPAVDDTANEGTKSEELKQKKRRRQKKKKAPPTEVQTPTLEPVKETRDPPFAEKDAEPAFDVVAPPKKEKKKSTNLEDSADYKDKVETADGSTDNGGTKEGIAAKKKKDKKTKAEKKAKKERQKDKKRKKKSASTIEGISTSRMSSYGL